MHIFYFLGGIKRLVKIVIVKQISNFEIKEVSEDIDFLARIKTADYNGGLLYIFFYSKLVVGFVCGLNNVRFGGFFSSLMVASEH